MHYPLCALSKPLQAGHFVASPFAGPATREPAHASSRALSIELELGIHNIAQANIDRFTQLLETELDSEKRAMIVQLLSEEKSKLAMAASSARQEATAGPGPSSPDTALGKVDLRRDL